MLRLFSSSSSDRVRLASLGDRIATARSVALLAIVLVLLSSFFCYPTSNQGEKHFILLSMPQFYQTIFIPAISLLPSSLPPCPMMTVRPSMHRCIFRQSRVAPTDRTASPISFPRARFSSPFSAATPIWLRRIWTATRPSRIDTASKKGMVFLRISGNVE